jgi:hypothetical protein
LSTQPFKLRIRIDDKEVELSGSQQEVMSALEDLPKIVNKFSSAFMLNTTSTQHLLHVESKTEEKDVYPTLTISTDASCPEALTKILSTNWGKKKPRTLNELLEVMKINAVHYPKGTIKGRLTDLTKKGILRRIRTSKGYGYILVKELK